MTLKFLLILLDNVWNFCNRHVLLLQQEKKFVYDKMNSYQDFLKPLLYLPLLAKLRQNTIRKIKNVNLENKSSKEF